MKAQGRSAKSEKGGGRGGGEKEMRDREPNLSQNHIEVSRHVLIQQEKDSRRHFKSVIDGERVEEEEEGRGRGITVDTNQHKRERILPWERSIATTNQLMCVSTHLVTHQKGRWERGSGGEDSNWDRREVGKGRGRGERREERRRGEERGEGRGNRILR